MREAVPPDPVSTRDPSQLAIAASPRGGASLPQRRNQADEAHQQEETRAEEKSDEQEDNETDGNPIIEEFLQAILLDHEQAVSPVGSEIAAGESMAVLMQGLRSRNEKLLRTARAYQARLLEFGERVCQRPRGAAGRDDTWRVPRSWGNWGHAGDAAAAPGTADAFQPGVEFPQATLRQEKQACSATEREKVAALFIELRMQNEDFLEKAIAQRAQQTEAWQNESEERERKLNEFDQAFAEGIARLERRWGATHVTQGWLLKGSWV